MLKKITFAAAAIILAFTGTSYAEPMVGQKLKVVETYGQPFCAETDQLKEFLVAALTKDNEALTAILREGNCTMLKKGTMVSVLEDLGDEDEELHGLKVRAMNKKVSAVGYTMSVGMKAR
jgi:hypothetical protein